MKAVPWMVAATTCLSVAAIQTFRLRNHATTVLELTRENRSLEAVESAYRETALRVIRAELESDSLALDQGTHGTVYMIVDTQCPASKDAVLALKYRGTAMPVVVASYLDGPDRIRQWLLDLGADFAVMPVPVHQTPLKSMPRGITPIYLELDEVGPIDVHVGKPKEEWFRQDPQVPEREVREVFRLGDGTDVPDWAAFVREPDLALDAAGRLYARPLGDDPRVRVIDENGGFVRYIGRKGNGPAEFTTIDDMGFAADTLWLRDWPPDRTSFFDSAGTHLKTETTVPAYAGLEPGHDGETIPLRDGWALYTAPRTTTEYGRVRVPLMVGIRELTEKRDTVEFQLRPTGMIIRGVGTFHWEPVTLSPLVVPLARGNGIAAASWTADRPGEVVLRRVRFDGFLSREDTLRFSVAAISPEARDRIVADGMEKAKGPYEFHRKRFGGTPNDLRDAVIEGLALPSHYSPLQDMFATPEDRIWVRATAVEDQSDGDWFVVGSDGVVNFRVRPPSGVTFKTAHGDRVWGVGQGYLDTPYIALYELSQPPQGKEG